MGWRRGHWWCRGDKDVSRDHAGVVLYPRADDELSESWRQGWNAAWTLGDKESSAYYLRKFIDEGRRAHVVNEEEAQMLSELMLFLAIR